MKQSSWMKGLYNKKGFLGGLVCTQVSYYMCFVAKYILKYINLKYIEIFSW